MLSAITKPLESLTDADLQELTQQHWPESENVEYKGDLYSRDNQRDPWYCGGNISPEAKNKLFKEIVAFANTSGGRLFIGITETRDGPPSADAIKPIPRCNELATRLEQSIISSIDPPLTFFRVFGVATDRDSGVVVVEVSRSYNGPHRSPDLNCYVRKGTHSVPVGMREIHDIVMRLSRRQDEIKQFFAERDRQFRAWIRGIKAAGFRVTALPVGAPLYLDRVFNNSDISREPQEVTGKWTSAPESNVGFSLPVLAFSERPTLGGTVWLTSSSGKKSQKFISRDGLIDTWFLWDWQPKNPPQNRDTRAIIPLEGIIAASADLIASAGAFKQAAQVHGCEYGIQVQLLATNGASEVPVVLAEQTRGHADLVGSAFPTPAMLGPYSLGDRDDLMKLIVRDLYDASGVKDARGELQIDWDSFWR